MYELSEQEMMQVNGGGTLKYIIYAIFGAAFYKLWRSKRGRVSIPKFIQLEWGSDEWANAHSLYL